MAEYEYDRIIRFVDRLEGVNHSVLSFQPAKRIYMI